MKSLSYVLIVAKIAKRQNNGHRHMNNVWTDIAGYGVALTRLKKIFTDYQTEAIDYCVTVKSEDKIKRPIL